MSDPNPTPKAPAGEDVVVIWSDEHRAYWRPDAAGYTKDIAKAGRYARQDATRRTSHCGPEKAIEIRPAPDPAGEGERVQEWPDLATRLQSDHDYQRAVRLLDEFGWSSNVSRDGRLMSKMYVVAEAVANTFAADRRAAEARADAAEEVVKALREGLDSLGRALTLAGTNLHNISIGADTTHEARVAAALAASQAQRTLDGVSKACALLDTGADRG
jgi:hypothetical protein